MIYIGHKSLPINIGPYAGYDYCLAENVKGMDFFTRTRLQVFVATHTSHYYKPDIINNPF